MDEVLGRRLEELFCLLLEMHETLKSIEKCLAFPPKVITVGKVLSDESKEELCSAIGKLQF